MSRYIDAFKLKKKLREIRQRSITVDRMLKIIDEQPTADVQEVVRCKDCKHIRYSKAFTYHDADEKHIRVRDCPVMGRMMKDDDFCSCGAKRSEQNDKL